MKQPKKWAQDPEGKVYSLPEFERAREARRMVFVAGLFRGGPVSVELVAHMSHALVMRLIYEVRITLAVQSEEYRDWLRAELLGEDRQPVCDEWVEADYEIVDDEPKALRRVS